MLWFKHVFLGLMFLASILRFHGLRYDKLLLSLAKIAETLLVGMER